MIQELSARLRRLYLVILFLRNSYKGSKEIQTSLKEQGYIRVYLFPLQPKRAEKHLLILRRNLKIIQQKVWGVFVCLFIFFNLKDSLCKVDMANSLSLSIPPFLIEK